MQLADKRLTKRIEVAGELSDVWKAWTTKEGAEAFFAPETQIEARPGGPYEIWFFPENPPGQRGAENLKVLSVLPQDTIAFEWDAPPRWPEVRKHRTRVEIKLARLSEDLTSVTLTHLGWKEGQDWDEVYHYFDSAWETVLKRLKTRFESGPIDWKALN